MISRRVSRAEISLKEYSANCRYVIFLIKKRKRRSETIGHVVKKISGKLSRAEEYLVRENLRDFRPYVSRHLYPQDWFKST